MEPVRSNDAYGSVINVLIHKGHGFEASEHYRMLLGNGEDLPGVVGAAYARYIADRVRASDAEFCASLVAPLNEIASLNNSKIETMLRDEVLEQFDADEMLDILRPFFNDALARIDNQRR